MRMSDDGNIKSLWLDLPDNEQSLLQFILGTLMCLPELPSVKHLLKYFTQKTQMTKIIRTHWLERMNVSNTRLSRFEFFSLFQIWLEKVMRSVFTEIHSLVLWDISIKILVGQTVIRQVTVLLCLKSILKARHTAEIWCPRATQSCRTQTHWETRFWDMLNWWLIRPNYC